MLLVLNSSSVSAPDGDVVFLDLGTLPPARCASRVAQVAQSSSGVWAI